MITSSKPFVVYKSSAGSGKTFTLAKSYLAIALSGPDPDYFKTILAITFTNKAANEMRERILNALHDFAVAKWDGPFKGMAEILCNELAIDKDELKKRSLEIYTLMLHRYNDINISTIDKFVHRIVRIFAHDLNLPLNFEIRLDEEVLLAEAVHKLIQSANERDFLFDLLVKFAEDRTDEGKSWNIENELFKFSKIIPKEDSFKHLEKLKSLSVQDFEEIKNAIYQKINSFNKLIAEIAHEAIEFTENSGLSINDFYQGTKGIGNWFERIREGQWKVLERPNNYVEETIYNDVWYSKSAKHYLKSKIDSIAPTIKNYYFKLEKLAADELPKIKVLNSVLNKLYQTTLLNEIDYFFQKLKRDEGQLNISEFNKRINEIINTEPAPFIYERLGEKYHHFLIDEFQDTSIYQFQNFLPLIDNALAEQYNCLLVGDSKQAIYRWRGGAVEQMDYLPELLGVKDNPLLIERQESLKRYYDLKILKNNFRSKKEIVEFNNLFFKEIKKFLNPQLQKIYDNHEQNPKPDNEGGFVKCIFLEESANKAERLPKHLDAVINEIQFLTSKGIAFSEIAILAKENKDLIVLSEFLIKHNIPVISSETVLLRNNEQIKFILNYLRWINKPNSQLFFYQWFYSASQIGLFSKAQEMVLFNKDDKRHATTKAEIYKEYLLDCNFSQLSLIEKVEKIIALYLKNLNPYNAFIVSFLDVINDFGSQNMGGGVSEFLDFWEIKQDKFAAKLSANSNAVKLTTIHKSKGLEFPFVLLPFASWEIKVQHEEIWAENRFDEIKLPSFLLKLDDNLVGTDYENFLTDERNKSLLDTVNLLYVAFTRAEKGLIIITDNFVEKSNKQNKANAQEPGIKFVSQILNKTFLKYESKDNVFQLGEFHSESQSHQDFYSKENPLTYYSTVLWHDKIDIKAGREFDEDWKTDEQIVFGENFHLMMENFLKHRSFDSTKEFLLSNGLHTELISSLNQTLNVLRENEFFKIWLSEYETITVEQDILIPGNKKQRPDWVLRKGNQYVVVDFKTGDKSEKHIKQVEGYKLLIEQLFNQAKVSAYLAYVGTHNVEVINA